MVIKKTKRYATRSTNYVTKDPEGRSLKDVVVTSVFTLIKMGIDDRKIFKKFLASHNILPSNETTLSDYIAEARRKIDIDFGNTAWLTEKIQMAHLADFRKIYETTDQFIEENQKLLKYVYQKAKLKAKRLTDDESRFPEFLEFGTVRDVIHTGLEANTKKRELMEKGFFVYSFKRYVDTLQAKLSGDITEEEKQNILSNDPMLKSIDIMREKEKERPINVRVLGNKDVSKIEEDPQKEFQLNEHLKGLEKRFGQLSDLE